MPPWLEAIQTWDECSECPAGTWAPRPEPRGRPRHPIALNVADVRGLVPHEEARRSVGCCGVGYRERLPNLRCGRCGQGAAFRLSDGDHCRHAIFVAETPLATEPVDEPDDAELQAAFSARRMISGAIDAAGMDAVPRRLRIVADALWRADEQEPGPFPQLEDFSMTVVGLAVGLTLDGVTVRPPWPDGERERVIAMQTLPRGWPDDPLSWWADVDVQRHEWFQWVVGDELCVGWQAGREAVAFRLPWELWELTFREALRA